MYSEKNKKNKKKKIKIKYKKKYKKKIKIPKKKEEGQYYCVECNNYYHCITIHKTNDYHIKMVKKFREKILKNKNKNENNITNNLII